MLEDTSTPPTAEDPSEQPENALMGAIIGYFDAQIVGVTARLGIADRLASGPLTRDQLADATGADPGGLARFLRACERVGLVRQPDPGRYALTPMAEPLVCRDSDAPGRSTFMRTFATVYTSPGQWMPWGRLFEAVMTGKAAAIDGLGMGLWEYYSDNPGEGGDFAELMSMLSADAAHALVAGYDFTDFTRIVDVGGSHGVLLSAVLAAAPRAVGVLFDLPEVVRRAASRPAVAQLGSRVELTGGDFLSGVPGGGDLYLLKQVLCDWEDKHAGRILANCHSAAPPGSTLLVIDWMLADDDDDSRPSPFAIMDLGLLVASEGRVRTRREYQRLLEDAGYRFSRVVLAPGQFPAPWCIIEAVRD